jgi:hypothetical protein
MAFVFGAKRTENIGTACVGAYLLEYIFMHDIEQATTKK